MNCVDSIADCDAKFEMYFYKYQSQGQLLTFVMDASDSVFLTCPRELLGGMK